MTESIAVGAGWIDNDVHMTRDAVRVAPVVERLDLLVRLARAAPDEEVLGYLGAGAFEDYLVADPDVAGVEALARRDERFRIALNAAWYDSRLSPEDAARLRRFRGSPG